MNAFLVSLKKFVERAGAEVDLKRAILALYRMDSDGKVTEAIMDAVVLPPGCHMVNPVPLCVAATRMQNLSLVSSPWLQNDEQLCVVAIRTQNLNPLVFPVGCQMMSLVLLRVAATRTQSLTCSFPWLQHKEPCAAMRRCS